MIRAAAKVFGIVFILIGVLGFVPALTPDNHLLGLFHINAAHNWVHILSGIIALWVGFSSFAASKIYFQVFGIVYGLVALLGFVYGEQPILGVLASNVGDTFLHIAITASALYFGFGAPSKKEAA